MSAAGQISFCSARAWWPHVSAMRRPSQRKRKANIMHVASNDDSLPTSLGSASLGRVQITERIFVFR